MKNPIALLLCTALGLSACESSLDVDLAADPLDNATRVVLPLNGVVLRKAEGEERRVASNDTADVDLLQFDGNTLFGLISNGDVKDGEYRGVRLLVDQDGFLDRANGTRIPIDLDANPPFADVAFSIDEDDGDNIVLLLALDLRLSLSETSNNRFLLRPVLRAVRSGDDAELRGSVASALLSDSACNFGAAVYAFRHASADENVEPDERDGVGVEPYATAPVLSDRSYRLQILPAGTYTLALTCDGEREDGFDAASPDMSFSNEREVDLDENESRIVDLSQ